MTPDLNAKRDVFIAHAGEDKRDFARPLAEGLRDAGIAVWFDEFELRPGQSLRTSLDRGLASSRYGVVVLSHAFFGKKWPEYELDGMIQLFDVGFLIPIWHGVGHAEVQSYSASLSDKVAIPSSKGVDHAVSELERIIRGGAGGPQRATGGAMVPALPMESAAETTARARALIPKRNSVAGTMIVAVACAPRAPAMRPKQFGDAALRRALLREATFGSPAIFDSSQGNTDRMEGDAVVLEQVDRRIRFDAEGSVVVTLPAVLRRGGVAVALPSLIGEEVEGRLECVLSFIADVLDLLDPTGIWSGAAVIAALLGCQHLGWRTREEADRQPNQMSLNVRSDHAVVETQPARRPRGHLRDRNKELAEDLTELLGRQLTAQ